MRKTKIALAFCLMTALLFSPLAGMDNHGANVVVTKKDGTLAGGELITVKRNALVVSAGESSPGESVSVAIEDIENVEVIKKSKVGNGMLWGALIGGGIGVAGGLIAGRNKWFFDQNLQGVYGLIGGVIGLGTGLLFGLQVGKSVSENKTFRFDFSKEDRDSALLQLSEYAAIKGVR